MIGDTRGEGPENADHSSLERTAQQDHQPDCLAEKRISISPTESDAIPEPYIARYPLAVRILIFIIGSLSAWALVYWAMKG
jgi:hypothetical protein